MISVIRLTPIATARPFSSVVECARDPVDDRVEPILELVCVDVVVAAVSLPMMANLLPPSMIHFRNLLNRLNGRFVMMKSASSRNFVTSSLRKPPG